MCFNSQELKSLDSPEGEAPQELNSTAPEESYEKEEESPGETRRISVLNDYGMQVFNIKEEPGNISIENGNRLANECLEILRTYPDHYIDLTPLAFLDIKAAAEAGNDAANIIINMMEAGNENKNQKAWESEILTRNK